MHKQNIPTTDTFPNQIFKVRAGVYLSLLYFYVHIYETVT